MKAKKSKMHDEVNSSISVCRKCGEPLRSTNKSRYCDNCRRERATKKGNLIKAVGGLCVLGLSIIPGVNYFTNKK